MVQSNPFGSAKPVDTVARLKELEERDAKRKVRFASQLHRVVTTLLSRLPARQIPMLIHVDYCGTDDCHLLSSPIRTICINCAGRGGTEKA